MPSPCSWPHWLCLLAGSAGGTLYTFHSGPDGFFTRTYFSDTGAEIIAFETQFTPFQETARRHRVAERTARLVRFADAFSAH